MSFIAELRQPWSSQQALQHLDTDKIKIDPRSSIVATIQNNPIV